MKRLACCATIMALALTPAAGLAGNGKGKAKGQRGIEAGRYLPVQGIHCPPGLAKKNPPCVPPGQARKIHRNDGYIPAYRVGDRITGDYVVITDPARFGLNPRRSYYRVGNDIFLVDPDTREVLDFIGAAAALLD